MPGTLYQPWLQPPTNRPPPLAPHMCPGYIHSPVRFWQVGLSRERLSIPPTGLAGDQLPYRLFQDHFFRLKSGMEGPQGWPNGDSRARRPRTPTCQMAGGGGSSSSCRQFVTLAPGQAPRQLYGSSGTHTPWIHQCDFGVTNLTCQQPSPSRGELCTPTEGALPNLSQLPKVPENGVPLLCTPCFVGGGAVLGTREGGIWQTIT